MLCPLTTLDEDEKLDLPPITPEPTNMDSGNDAQIPGNLSLRNVPGSSTGIS